MCGAVPLTRSVLQHSSVRQEIQEIEHKDASGPEVVVENSAPDFDWASYSLDELEAHNKASCNWLIEQGYNGGELQSKVNRRPKSLQSRLPSDASLEERIKAIVSGGVSLSSLFYTVGPTCLSTDEIFMAFEYRERLKQHEVDKKKMAAVEKDKALEDKAKAILALQKPHHTKPELETLLKWKLGAARYSAEHSRKSAAALLLAWQQHANDPNPPDVAMPPPLEAPRIPAIDETELGHARHRQFLVALQSATNYNDAQLEELARVITGLCADRGIMQV